MIAWKELHKQSEFFAKSSSSHLGRLENKAGMESLEGTFAASPSVPRSIHFHQIWKEADHIGFPSIFLFCGRHDCLERGWMAGEHH